MNENEIRKHLRTKIFGKKIYCVDSIDSTNTYAKTLASQGADEGTVVSTEQQTAGHGRFHRTWISTPGESLTFSVITRPKIQQQYIGVLPLYAGVSVSEGLKGFSNIVPSCKWPNDVLLNGKKCCGILCEGVFSDATLTAVIIGIGLNINQREFPPTIAATATSLALACGQTFDRASVLAGILEKLEYLYTYIQRGDFHTIIQRWQQNTTMLGKEIIVEQQGSRFKGIAKTVAADGGLIVALNGTEKKVLAGEVTVVQ